ncbi:MAG: hypothetical protein QM804_15690 [Propionicimonas sp.]
MPQLRLPVVSERSRWVRARWRRTERTIWETELRQFGPLPARISDLQQAQDRNLWQAEAYAAIYLEADRARRHAAKQARRHGATWQQIGDALGISRQAAAKLIASAGSTTVDGFMVDHKAG